MPINADKPQLWLIDIQASVDLFNAWFMKFAPKAYLLLADQWLSEGGISAWLIPSEFMDVKYGLAVKHYLTRNVKLLHIHRFCPHDVQFSDALVSSAVVVFEKSSPSTNGRVT